MSMKKSRQMSMVLTLLLFVQLIFPGLHAWGATDNGTILPPSNLATQLLTPDDVKLTWSPVYGATGYTVYSITYGQLINVGTTTTASLTINNLAEGSYSYVVSTLSSEGESGPCAPVDVNIVYPDMTAPTSLTYTLQNGNNIVLNWGTAPNVQTYHLYENQEDGRKLVYSGTARTFTVNNTAEGIYTYTVTASHTLYGESPNSTPVEVTVGYPAMTAPNGLTYTVATDDVTLKWNAAAYATGYNVYQIIDNQKVIKSSQITGTTVSYMNLPAGNYTYVIHSFSDRFGESVEGSTVSLTVGMMVPPSNLTFKLQNVNDVVLTWNAAINATSYKVYQVIDGEKVLKNTVTGTTVTFTNMPTGDYVYEVHSLSNLFGESTDGSTVSLTIGGVTMTPPATFTSKLQNLTDIVLTWTVASNATSYKIYQVIGDEKVLKSTVTGTTVTYINMPAGDYVYEVHSVSTRFGESAEGTQTALTVGEVAMAAPGNFAYKFQNVNDIVLTWTVAPNATAYKVYQIVDGTKVFKSTVTGTTVTYANMPAGVYLYEVHSYSDRYGESVAGSQVSFTVDAVTMVAPGNPIAKVQNVTDVVLTWTAVANATNYKVYQVSGGQKVLKSTVTGTTVTYTNLAAGDYTYEIHSNSTRFGESAEGTQVIFSIVLPTILPPTNLVQSVTSATAFSLKWDAAAYGNSYKVYQIVNDQKVLKSTVATTTVSYTNMQPGDYTYVVHTVSTRFGESPEGTRLTFTLNGQTMQAPASLTYSLANVNDLTLKWTSVPYATSYKVYQIIDGQKVLKSTLTSLTVTYTNIPGGDYQYVVDSYSTILGESPEGAEVSFKLILPTMVGPGNLASKVQNGNDVVLTWDTVPYANSYKVYEIVNGAEVLKSTVTTLTVTYTNVTAGEHTYVVRSVSTKFGESLEGSKVILSMVFPVMQAPGSLTQTIANGNDISLKWGAVPYANSYKVYQIVDGQKVLKSTVISTSVSYLRSPAGDYKYEVHSYSTRFGESPEGSQVSFTLDQNWTAAPEQVTQTIVNGNDITLQWGAVANVTSYNIYQVINGEKVLKKSQPATSVTFANMPKGEYTYVVHAFGTRFGESPDGASVSFTLDFPVMQAPATLTQMITNGNDITLKWGTSTYANSYKVYQVVDGEKVLKSTLTGTTVAYTNMPAGDYTYEVHSYSSRFGESPEGRQLTYTLVHPILQAPGNVTKSVTNGNDITLKWGTVTYATSYRVYQIVDGQRELKKIQTGTTVTFTNMPEGDYNYEIYSYSDRFGESPKAGISAFNLTWPVLQPSQLKGTVTNANNLTLTWTAAAWANEYRVYEVTGGTRQLIYKGTALTTQIYNLSEKTHNYELVIYNTRFGESAPSNRLTFDIIYPDMQSPVAGLRLLSPTSAVITWNFITYTNGYNVYEIVNGQPILLVKNLNNLSYTVNNLSYANHLYYVASYSNSFGESDPSNTVEAKLIIDTEAPVTKATAPTDWTNQSAAVTLSATDNETGVANTFYSLNDQAFISGTTVNVSQEGLNKISYYSVDKVGNTEATKIIYVKIDKIAPLTKASEIQGWSKEVTVTLEAADSQSGVAKTLYSVNGGEYSEGTSVKVSQEGVSQVSFYSVDQVGNAEKAQTVEVKIDRTAPVTTATATEGWTKSDATVTLAVADSQSGVAKTLYSVNGGDYAEGTSVTVSQEGVSQVSFYSVDQAGNVEKAQAVEVKIDRTAPVTTATATEGWTKSDATVTLAAADSQSGVAKTLYSVNGGEYSEGTIVNVSQEGVSQVSFYSVDQAGNAEKTQMVEVKIDRTAPEITMNLSGEYKLNTMLTLSYSTRDILSGIVSDSMTVKGPGESVVKPIANESVIKLDKPGIYTISVNAINAAGLSTTIQKQFIVYIAGSIEVTPTVIKGNNGVFTVRVNLPEGFKSEGFDLNTAVLNGVKALSSNNGYYNQAKNGQFKFERSDFTWTGPNESLEFRGLVDGFLVVGQTIVKVQK
ncbi:fibronectin type III domain-containing protein [Paenibacillus sp. V4I7]|uniref:fibronectin type III domain-containing protein n=1 Tax=Paenibacillus sp. V4I7 TaxID=3042307 RepID=UPI002785215A|nr:fibronectin type III domain-containing protein [Paenibacillus sp. V4I7]MDQ0903121.1 fibronectin type 3 domain-containing protein [Paenibacillus sp. V4I7]